jgi:hypothetical protein
MWLISRLLLAIAVVFLLPSLVALGWWSLQDRPGSWRQANWGGSGVLPAAKADPDAAVYVMAARTGGLKGAFAVHSWIVTKAAGAEAYARYDKVGWGMPIRRDGYPADARWYSNVPWVVRGVHGAEAERLIPQVEAAIAAYPFSRSGDYHIWPGPNSNSFVAHVVAAVPELGARMPANATGRDYEPGFASLDWSSKTWDLHATFGGYLGLSAGWTSGLEVHFLGLVAGIDITEPALKVPAFGTVPLTASAVASGR